MMFSFYHDQKIYSLNLFHTIRTPTLFYLLANCGIMDIEGGNTAKIPHFSQLRRTIMMIPESYVKPFDTPFFYVSAQKKGVFSKKGVGNILIT